MTYYLITDPAIKLLPTDVFAAAANGNPGSGKGSRCCLLPYTLFPVRVYVFFSFTCKDGESTLEAGEKSN
jgi:hypothetical protein